MRFWKKPKLPKYRFQNSPQTDSTWVEITSGKYAGVIYSYGMVKLDETIGIPTLRFNFAIIHSGEHDSEVLKNDQEYVTIMGDILTEIIIDNDTIRTNNTEEPDFQ